MMKSLSGFGQWLELVGSIKLSAHNFVMYTSNVHWATFVRMSFACALLAQRKHIISLSEWHKRMTGRPVNVDDGAGET